MSTKAPVFKRTDVKPRARVAILAARFNADLVEELLKGCRRRLAELGLEKGQIELYRVPGAFELPAAASVAARTGRFDAIICLGAVVRGQTPHFDFVAGQCAQGLREVGVAEGLPVIFGVLTTNDEQQAWDRAGGKHGHAGVKAAEAAVEMIGVLQKIRGRS